MGGCGGQVYVSFILGREALGEEKLNLDSTVPILLERGGWREKRDL